MVRDTLAFFFVKGGGGTGRRGQWDEVGGLEISKLMAPVLGRA